MILNCFSCKRANILNFLINFDVWRTLHFSNSFRENRTFFKPAKQKNIEGKSLSKLFWGSKWSLFSLSVGNNLLRKSTRDYFDFFFCFIKEEKGFFFFSDQKIYHLEIEKYSKKKFISNLSESQKKEERTKKSANKLLRTMALN